MDNSSDWNEVRTSDTNPIQVKWLQGIEELLLPGKGKIGLTIAPGKKGNSFYGAPWDQDLAKDLDRLRDEFQISLLICLMEEGEMKRYKISNLLSEAQLRGIQTIHEPIPDLEPPSLEQAKSITDQALKFAKANKNVAIHCLGGCGRSGVIGACCYMAVGFDPAQALAMVRASREGAVESRSQEAFLHRFHSSMVFFFR